MVGGGAQEQERKQQQQQREEQQDAWSWQFGDGSWRKGKGGGRGKSSDSKAPPAKGRRLPRGLYDVELPAPLPGACSHPWGLCWRVAALPREAQGTEGGMRRVARE